MKNRVTYLMGKHNTAQGFRQIAVQSDTDNPAFDIDKALAAPFKQTHRLIVQQDFKSLQSSYGLRVAYFVVMRRTAFLI